MQNQSLADQLKARWTHMTSPESLALANAVQASSGVKKVTIPVLPRHGRVMVLEEVFDLPTLKNTTTPDQPK
jgi:hypothetical protein